MLGPLTSRDTVTVTTVALSMPLMTALLCSSDIFVLLVLMVRNCVVSKMPRETRAKYPVCSDAMLAKDLTIVVTVKDACSQGPGFLRALERFAPPSVHLVYTYPNFESCASIDLKKILSRWERATVLPLPLRSSPMQGWIDAVPYIKTKYSILLHNDGYALDSFFGCELLQGLKHHKKLNPGANYSLAAPMLYESKADGSLAAHATQTNLRLVKDASEHGVAVHHDHSLRRALNRGTDVEEGAQTEFVEDHGFMIETDKISTVIDPSASFTLEYIDMIMTIRAKRWSVLFVPTARLEFRITEFSWRDIPYFMYKRSEATAQSTRDYLSAKWKASFPNTGFWTYIKYTIIEQHTYTAKQLVKGEACPSSAPEHCGILSTLAWKDQAALAFSFFQMIGYNQYDVGRRATRYADFIEIIQRLDRGWSPLRSVRARHEKTRPKVKVTRPRYVESLDRILPYGHRKAGLECDFDYEYSPFSAAKLTLHTCDDLTPAMIDTCGLVIDGPTACVCWINLPTFRSNSLFIRGTAHLAALMKIPSRVTTFLEMTLWGSRNGSEHVAPLHPFEGESFQLHTCDNGESGCFLDFSFTKADKLVRFRGAPATVPAVSSWLKSL